MPVKLKYNNGRTATKQTNTFGTRVHMALLAAIGCLAIGVIIFTIAYYHYQHVVDDRLASGPLFANVSQIYAAPREVRTGQKLSAASSQRAISARPATTPIPSSAPSSSPATASSSSRPRAFHTDSATISTPDDEVQALTAENSAASAPAGSTPAHHLHIRRQGPH